MEQLMRWFMLLFCDKLLIGYQFNKGDIVVFRKWSGSKKYMNQNENLLKFGSARIEVIKTFDVNPGDLWNRERVDPLGLGQHVVVRADTPSGSTTEGFHSGWMVPANSEDEVKKRDKYPSKIVDQYYFSSRKMTRVILVVLTFAMAIFLSMFLPSDSNPGSHERGIIVGLIWLVIFLPCCFLVTRIRQEYEGCACKQ
ncbi:MAG: hypothetical protein Q7K40_01595 [bacterium]|nr:hypothetical protein [bacterium]